MELVDQETPSLEIESMTTLKVKRLHRQNIIVNELTNWALGGPGLNSNMK